MARTKETGAADAVSEVPMQRLYRSLQPRWSGLDAEEVAAHQRLRLCGAMLEAVASRGYHATSVNELARMAGVSKRTVYDRFGSKEGLFLATFDVVVESAIARIRSAHGAGTDPRLALCAAFRSFLQIVVEEPGAARVALVEAFGAGPGALARIERGRRLFEVMIAASVGAGAPMPRPMLIGLVGGVEGVTRMHLLTGTEHRLPDLADDMAAWVACYETQAARSVAQLPARQAPTLAVNWNAWLSRGDERTRMLRATIAIAGQEGYDALTPEAISKLAGLPAGACGAIFPTVEECFLAALELAGVEALANCMQAGGDASGWELRVCRALEALMDHLAAHPVLARVVFVEAFAPGVHSMPRRAAAIGRFTSGFDDLVPRDARVSPLKAKLAAGAAWALMHRCVARGAKDLLPSLAGQAAFLVLAPVLGSQAAAACIADAADDRARRDG